MILQIASFSIYISTLICFQLSFLIMMEYSRLRFFMLYYFSHIFYYRLISGETIDKHLQKLIDLRTSSDSLFTAANLNVALMNLMLYILDHTELVHEREHAEPQLQNSYVAYTLNYIQTHYSLQKSYKKTLHNNCIFPSVISVNFSRVIWASHYQTILIFIVSIAPLELMQDTNLTLTEIALQVGFKDSQHYSKVFGSVINATPSQYRKTFLIK